MTHLTAILSAAHTMGSHWQMTVTIIILALALVYVVIKVLRLFRGKGGCPSCHSECRQPSQAHTCSSAQSAGCEGCPLARK